MWSGAGYVAQYVVTFAFTVVTARLLNPSDFGLMGLAVVVLAVGTLLADSGTQSALIHREHDLDKANNTALNSTPLAGLGAALVGSAVAPILALFYGQHRLVLITSVLSGVLLVRSLGLVPDAILLRRMQFKWRRAVVDPLGALVGGVTATVMALMGYGVWALVAQWYASTATLVIGSWILARYKPDLRKANVRTWRELSSYGRSILGAHTIQLAYGYIDTVAIGRNLPVSAVGWYGAANRLAILPVSGITHVAGSALFPAFSRMQGDRDRLRDRFLESLRYISLLTIPVCVAFACVSTVFMATIFGEDWRPSGPVIAVLMLWAIPYSLSEVAMEGFKGVGKPGIVMWLSLVKFGVFFAWVAVVWITGNIAMGLVAGGLSVAMVVALIVALPYFSKHLGATPGRLWHACGPAIMGGLVSGGIMVPITHWGGLRGMERWHEIAGLEVGMLAPLVGMALVAIVVALLFYVTVEFFEQGAARSLIAQGRGVIGGRSGEAQGA
jgi:O-antigen/teichoic acid export membrane protein